jgi:spermidine synthase
MILFIISILLSAFLLFQVQPLIGKIILPWFGGTSAVWSAALLFFQVLLTGGYAYAYWLTDRFSARRQTKIHLTLLSLSFVLMAVLAFVWPSPITPDSSLAISAAQHPIWNIFRVLVISVGLPYFVLATNSTVIQAWFTHVNPDRSPYWLYAVSNAGSLLALVSYPFLIEPVFPLITQGWLWTAGFILFLLVVMGIILRIAPQKSIKRPIAPSQHNTPASRQLLWVALSATASVLLLSTTSQLTQEVAPIPFLWVLPLTVYLLSFVITFSGEGRYHRLLFSILLVLGSTGIFLINHYDDVHFLTQVAAYIFFLFVACMAAHGELYKLRPTPESLPRFYLLVSMGGALGGVSVSLLAPAVFKGYWEFYLGWAGLLVLLTVLLFIRKTKKLKSPWRIGHYFLAGSHTILVLVYSFVTISTSSINYLYQERNFYGVSVVYHDSKNEVYRLIHGTTVHGLQFIDQDQRGHPTTYYWEQSGIARIIRSHPRYRKNIRVGVLGLGIGTLAAYGQSGDHYRFYEINPDMVELANGQNGYFTFLQDSQAEISIITDDARIALEREISIGENQAFDLLVMDAFSSDAIPVHLLTREAFELYLQHLSPRGVIAVHITNRYLDLKPVVWQIAQEFGLHTAYISVSAPVDNPGAFYSEWMLLASDSFILETPEIAAAADFMEGYTTDIHQWTDDYGNLFQILDR